jgi:hypothetical protein
MPKFSKKRAHTPEDDGSAEEQALKPSKKSKGDKSGKATDAEGPFWEVCRATHAMWPETSMVRRLMRTYSSCHPSDAST